MSLASYQGWDVGAKTGPKVYQCVVDAAPYRWPQQQHHHQQQQHRNHQVETSKTSISGLSMCMHHCSSSHCESSSQEPTSKSSVSEATTYLAGSSPVSCSKPQYGECGPVSSYVLPSLASYPGSERVPLLGEDLEVVKSLASGRSGGLDWSNGSSSQRGLWKVHPHDHDDDLDSCVEGSTQPTTGPAKDCLDLPSMVSPPSLFQTVGPALSSSSSSIGVGGEHSFSSEGSEDNNGDGEVQSALRPAALSTLSALEDSLPIKRGLSRYFTGQSKSFGCLSDSLSTSLAKPANPYARRRKTFVLLSEDRQRTCPPVSRKSASGISKRNSFGNKSNLALAVAMEAAQQEEDDNDNFENDDYDEEDEEEENDHPTPLPRMGLGRFQGNTPSRSYSLSDLQGVGRG
ncbi:unnamed protein product [Calypogeia fissa]